MPIEFRCSQCDQLLRVPEGSEGRSARCPRCQALVRVPEQPGDASLPLAEARPAPGGLESPPGPFADSAGALNRPPDAAIPENPFREDAAGSPFRSAAPPLQPSGYAAPNQNPYATPLGGYESAYEPAVARTGLPWEVRGPGFSSWWETAWLCMTTPAAAFQQMRQYGGIGSPMLFAVCGMLIGQLGQLVWQFPLIVLPLVINNNDAAAIGIVQVATQLLAGIIGALMGATIGLLFFAALHHLVLVLVGGNVQTYETTYRVVAFVNGSIAWLNVIPCLGPLVAILLYVACLIIGLAQGHGTTTGKAALAVLAPFLLCLAFSIALVGAVVYTSVGVQGLLIAP